MAVCEQIGCADTFLPLNKSDNSLNVHKHGRSPKSRGDLLAIDYLDPERGIEIYSQQLKQWTRIDSMPINCTYFGAEVVDEQLFIIGGMGNMTMLNLVNVQN